MCGRRVFYRRTEWLLTCTPRELFVYIGVFKLVSFNFKFIIIRNETVSCLKTLPGMTAPIIQSSRRGIGGFSRASTLVMGIGDHFIIDYWGHFNE